MKRQDSLGKSPFGIEAEASLTAVGANCREEVKKKVFERADGKFEGHLMDTDQVEGQYFAETGSRF